MRRRIPPLLLAICAAALFFSYLVQFPREGERFGFPLDDGWIHATYARNLAERGEFAFNPGERSTGTTSLLWTLLLAGLFRITGDIVAAAHLLGTAACLLFLLSLQDLTSRIFQSRAYGLCAGIMALCSGFVAWWSLSGMETMLFVALGIFALESFGGKKYLRAAILLALLTLTRPEGVLLAFILLVFLFRGRHTVPSFRGTLLRFGAASLSGALIYAGWNLFLTGRVVTSTLAGRRWLANAPIDMPLDPVYYLQKAGGLFVGWSRILAFSYIPQDLRGSLTAGILVSLLLVLFLWRPLGRARIAPAVSIAAGAAGLLLISLLFVPEHSWKIIIDGARQAGSGAGHALVRAFESTGSGLSGKRAHILCTAAGSCLLAGSLFALLFRRASHRPEDWKFTSSPLVRIFFFWVIAHNLLYVIFVPYPGHGGRYQSINLVLLIWVTLAGWKLLMDARPLRASMRRLRLLLAAAAAVALISVGSHALSSWRTIYFSTVEHINHVHRQTAEWIGRQTPEEARIAAFDIGAIGYFAHRRVVDLGGLITPDPIPFMGAGNIDEYIARARATHLAMMYRFDEQLDNRSIAKRLGVGSGRLFTTLPLYEARYDSLEWRRNVLVVGNAYPVLIVSKIVYPPVRR